MAEFGQAIRQYLEKLREFWSGLNLNQKVLIVGAVVLIIAAVTFSSSTLMKTDYVPLYTELDPADAYAITTKLTELNIPYQLADDGATITVPTEQKYPARLQMAGANLPKSTAGLELFTTTNFGETDMDKKVKYQMALQGELIRTIESLNKVDTAKVNLAVPEKSLFTEKQEDPTASVVVTVKPNEELTRKEVTSIIHLVASSIEGLKPENVTLVDSEGNLLSSTMSGLNDVTSTMELTQAQVAMKQRQEKELQEKAQSMLEQILGPRKAVVRVVAELNFDDKSLKKETYGPNSFTRSERIYDESSTATEQTTGGIPGTETNVPSYQQAGTGNGGVTSSQKSEKIRNYEIDKEEVNQRFAVGDVKRLTVSVVVDKSLDTQQTQQIQDTVANAVGFSQDRGDTISVVGMKFTQAEQPMPEKGWIEVSIQYWWLLVPLLLVLAAALIFLIRTLTVKPVVVTEEAGFEALVEEEIKVEDLLDRDLSPEERELKRIREEIEKLVDTKPEEVANILRTWLLDDMR